MTDRVGLTEYEFVRMQMLHPVPISDVTWFGKKPPFEEPVYTDSQVDSPVDAVMEKINDGVPRGFRRRFIDFLLRDKGLIE